MKDDYEKQMGGNAETTWRDAGKSDEGNGGQDKEMMVGEKMKADNIKGDKMKGWWGDKTMRDQMKA